MEVEQIIGYILSVLVPGIAAWNFKQQTQISELKTEVAVNTSKDEQMWGHVTKMEEKLDKLIVSVNKIREDLAVLKK